jgi:benzylsuccinate CoA-transferase BbsF subunit
MVFEDVFKGIKVVDFGWILAGPIISKFLADHGATVIWIESMKKPDLSRVSSPYKDGVAGVDRAGYFALWAANKFSIKIDLSLPMGLALAKRLVAWADVVSENRRTGAMEKMGLGYDELRKIKKDIIMIRSSNQGQSGPFSAHPGLGNNLNGLAGFNSFVGWADEEPLSLMVAYADFLAPPLAVTALIAALDHRRKTGQGQCLDISQLEASLQYLIPPLLDYVANGVENRKMGNAHNCFVPHGVYRCKGEDRWCAIAVCSDEDWKRFCAVIGKPQLTQDPRFSTLLGRKENEKELDGLVEAWTAIYSAEEVMHRLQEAGIAAGVVKNSQDVLNDPQLRERGLYWVLHHPELGEVTHLGQPYVLSKTPARPYRPAPCMGEHTEHVCRHLLGMSEEEFDELLVAGVFE